MSRIVDAVRRLLGMETSTARQERIRALEKWENDVAMDYMQWQAEDRREPEALPGREDVQPSGKPVGKSDTEAGHNLAAGGGDVSGHAFQVWHPAQPDAHFPTEYTRVAVVEATSLHQAADSAGRGAQEGDVVVTPELIAFKYDGQGQFSAVTQYRAYDKYPHLRDVMWPEDKAYAAALLGVDSPTPEQVDRIISRQQAACREEAIDRAPERLIDDWYEWLESQHAPEEFDPERESDEMER